MLEILRKSAGSWVAKILFGLLILSFGVWGIGDVIRGGGEQTVAIKVGDVEVGPQYVRQQFDRRVERLRQIFGPQLTTEQARQMGMVEATVREIVSSTTLDMAARDLGITASENAIRESLRQTKAFQNQDGSFSPDLFRRVLAANNLTEDRYLAMLKGDMARQRLGGALSTGVAPAPLVDRLFAYRQEKRSVEVLRVAAQDMTVEETPDEAALRDIYDAQITRFTAPEYRQGVAILLRQDDLTDRVEVSEQDIADFYQANPGRYTTPAKREVEQVITDDQKTAAEVAHLAQGGESLAEAAQKAGAPAPLNTGTVAADGLPPTASDAVFALDAGGVTGPVQTPLGWHVFHVSKIIPGSEQSLDAVHDQIRQEIAHERAVDVLYDESAKLEDTLGGGATLEEASDNLDLPLVSIPAVDVDGKPRDGSLPDALAGDAGKTVIGTLFELEEGLDSRLREIPGGYVVVRVDKVTPPAPRPFETVKDTVRTLWLGQKRQEKAEDLAKALVDEARGPRVFQSLADDRPGVSVAQVAPLTRAAIEQGRVPLPADLANQIFTMSPGQTTSAATSDGAAVVRLTAVTAADPNAQSTARDGLVRSLGGEIGQDLATEAITAYGERYGVEINNAVIQRAF